MIDSTYITLKLCYEPKIVLKTNGAFFWMLDHCNNHPFNNIFNCGFGIMLKNVPH